MRKGKLGVVVCLYPILGFVCVILNQPLLCALIFGFVLVAERDEWAGRQCLQAVGLSAIAVVLRELLVYSVNLFPVYIDFFHFLSKYIKGRPARSLLSSSSDAQADTPPPDRRGA